VTNVVPAATLRARINNPADPMGLKYDKPATTIPGNIAGGISAGGPPGNTAVDPDTRDVDGALQLALDAGGTTLTITPALTFKVHDTVDFCPGALGSAVARVETVPMSILEATERKFGTVFAADVPFDVSYPGPGTAIKSISLPAPAPPTPVPPAPAPPTGPGSYTVVKGDYLIKIANDQCGDPAKWKDIYNANSTAVGGPISDPNRIYPGWVLNIPCASAPIP
jgi:nucleoid-associated protein YgaU